MTEPDDLSALKEEPFAQAVEKLEKLLAQSGRAFLIGAGCSKCAGLPLMAELTDKVLKSGALSDTTKEILTAIRDQFGSAAHANIEDSLSELIDLLAIADRRTSCSARKKEITVGNNSYSNEQLRTAATQIKQGIASVIEKKMSIETHRHFVRAVHRPLRPGKPASDQTVDYLVLNYDTALEDALALECVSYADGMDGGATAWWRPEIFERQWLSARVFKLHGSIDWRELPDNPLPRRIGTSLEIDTAEDQRILIWPASTKYRETQLDPYAQLLERARNVLRPSTGSHRVLVICGYGFGDVHINIELDHALRESAGDLTLVAFTSDNAPNGQLKKWREDSSIREQLLIFANHGFFHGDVKNPTETNLLWWRFENITRLLGGER